MYRNLSVATIVPVLNEEQKIHEVVRRMPVSIVDDFIVVDDGSTDSSAEIARAGGATVISLDHVCGVGAALRTGFRQARANGADVVAVMAGNNKDSPEGLPVLLDPIADGRADFVQGSRWLLADRNLGAMPTYRRAATRIHPLLFSAVARRRVTDSTNGFRAIRSSVLSDERIDLDQDWLDGYELEPYLYLKAIRLGYRTVEVPVEKSYPPRRLGQTKMRPFVDWWSILRPVVLLGLGLRS